MRAVMLYCRCAQGRLLAPAVFCIVWGASGESRTFTSSPPLVASLAVAAWMGEYTQEMRSLMLALIWLCVVGQTKITRIKWKLSSFHNIDILEFSQRGLLSSINESSYSSVVLRRGSSEPISVPFLPQLKCLWLGCMLFSIHADEMRSKCQGVEAALCKLLSR